MRRLSLATMLLLVSCQADRPFPNIVVVPNVVEPLWSSRIGCSGGILISPERVSVARRIVEEYETWTFDAVSGTVLNVSTSSTRISKALRDTPADLTTGLIRPLDKSRAAAVAPRGFNPIVLTDQFLFAKRTRLRFERLHLYSEGQVAVVDLRTKNTVWADEGFAIAVLADFGRIIVCHDGETSVFSDNGGRPAEVSRFYAAIRAANAALVRELYPVWQKARMHDVDGNVPLSVAAKDGRLDVVKLLVELGESPNAADADGFTPLMMALHWNHPDVADFLLDVGAVPTGESPLWGSALRIAVREGRRAIINHLLRSGAKLNVAEAWSGNTALHEAVMYRNYEAIETLITGGVDVKALNKDGKTPGELAPMDECAIHLFRGGLIKEEPVICQPVKRETVIFDGGGFSR